MLMKPATKKKLALVLGIVVLLAIITSLILPKLIDPNRYHDRIISELVKALGGSVRIGHISWGVLKGLWLEVDGFEITGASAFPLDFKLSRIYAGVAIPLCSKEDRPEPSHGSLMSDCGFTWSPEATQAEASGCRSKPARYACPSKSKICASRTEESAWKTV
jgi:hypothetical protein